MIIIRKYFADICEVEEPESVFNVDQYSDVARITKPIIYISVGEIIDMHKVIVIIIIIITLAIIIELLILIF